MSLSVGIANHRVVIEADDPALVEQLTTFYQLMPAADDLPVAGTLTIDQRAGEQPRLVRDHQTVLPLDAALPVARHVIHAVTAILMEARPDRLWFHAGAAAHGDWAVLLPGLPGRGKSTLVGNLCMFGWRYLSDEIAPLDYTAGTVMAYPQMPWMRKDIGEDLPEARLYELQKTAIAITPEMVCRQPMPIGAVVCPDFRRGAASELAPCSPATAVLKLLQSCVNFAEHREQAIAAVQRLVLSIPVYALVFSDGQAAARLVSDALCDAA
ncbi:MAG: hypothetical protein IT324_33450 [Anaerolineae bacterium]|nr:hypothetical protein [Anaerolineae bacterium]